MLEKEEGPAVFWVVILKSVVTLVVNPPLKKEI